MKKNILLFVLFIVCFTSKSQTVKNYSIQAKFFPDDAQMYNIPIESDAFMRANAKVTFANVDLENISFFLHGELKVDSILSDEKTIDYKSEKVFYDLDYSLIANKVSFLSEEIASNKIIVVYYSGFINPSKARSLSDYMLINKDIGVLLRSHYYSAWFPIFIMQEEDDYVCNFDEVSITLPEGFRCVVTGELVEEKIEKGKYYAVWKPGLAKAFEVQCTARSFQYLEKDNIHVYHINNEDAAERIISFSKHVKDIFSKSFRNIPSNKPVIIMEMPKFGLISSGNVLGLTTPIFNNFENNYWSRFTLVHEMIHPYVQIPISEKNNFYAFVIEGFPTFFPYYVFKRMLKEEFKLAERMKRVETTYLKNRETGKSSRGEILPEEKPILEITPNEIGDYKDAFVLSDRVNLFFYHLWTHMGDEKFDSFVKELFVKSEIDYSAFEKLVLQYIPSYKKDLSVWLKSTDFPERFRLKE